MKPERGFFRVLPCSSTTEAFSIFFFFADYFADASLFEAVAAAFGVATSFFDSITASAFNSA
jgi:hypothetical protein